jgi:uncharacterized membrane protein
VIRFAAISWLIFLPLLVLAVVRFRALRKPLRVTCLALLLLVLIEPQVRRLADGLDLWVLVDGSASAFDALAPRLGEIETLLNRSKGADDRLVFVDYAEFAQLRDEADAILPHQRQQTRTALAVQFALSRMPENRAGRLLLLTDGYSTEPLAHVTERLTRQQVALDYRLISPAAGADYRIERLNLPARAQTGEAFLIEVDVVGDSDGEVTLEIARDGAEIGRAALQLRNGRASARFTDRLNAAGAHRYTARIAAENDARPGNNRAEKWIEIAGGRRVLLLTSYSDDPAAAVLRAQGFDVEIINDTATAHVGQLAGAAAVILNNVPAFKLQPEFLSALDFYVRQQGGGLLMAGGKFSFGSGGYFNSAVDPLLPVSMELRTEHRKLAVAMAIVLDRSGSMNASVGGNVRKMDLANEGAARAIELLGSMDAVTVFAVDLQAHEIIGLTSLQTRNRGELVGFVRRITSGGGGIAVPTGLRAARAQLRKATAGQRHVVLFADANDATQELGAWPTLLREMAKEGITVSVIGLGEESDSGGKFLRDVAELGNGRVFFNANAADLPAIFAQETIAVARSAFLEEQVALKPTANWLELAARPLEWLPQVDGYNLSYLKPEATAAAFSGDEYNAPLVAFWQRGAGRAAAVSFPLGGEFSQQVRGWANYGDFVQTLTRWAAGDELPPGIGLRTRIDGTQLRLDLLYDDEWEPRLARAAPRIVLGDGASGETRELVWERLAPGHFTASAPLQTERFVRGAVQVEGFTLPFGPLVASGSAEWTPDRARLLELQAVSRASGGVERVDLTKVWQAPRRATFADLRPLLLVVVLLLFVLEALFTRLGWELPLPRLWRRGT